jgi:hypothetical protein
MPAADASQCVDATIPNVPLNSGRVVNVTLGTLLALFRYGFGAIRAAAHQVM